MTNRIDIIAPATVALLGSVTSTSDPAPLSLLDSSGGIISVTIIAGNSAARLSASSASGATISSVANTLSIAGSLAQVNAALASLQDRETVPDTLLIIANDPALLSATTDIAVNVIPAVGAAFVAPPTSMNLVSYTVDPISGLVLANPAASALAAAGQGNSESLAVTLSAASGVLLLPGLSLQSGISASGVGTNQIILNFTATQLTAVNILLAGLQWAGPAAITGLAYAARDVAGPLGSAVTSGNITLDVTGVPGPLSTINSGADTAILGVSMLSLGSTLQVTQTVSDIGGIGGAGSVIITPDAALQMPYNQLVLGGTSYDFGQLGAASFSEAGTLIVSGSASVAGLVSLGSGALLDFAGTFEAGTAIGTNYVAALSLAAGAVLTGSGELVAGNFSEAGLISGAGEILAGGGETIVIAAGDIIGTTLDVAAGGVLALGPLDPLYGVFSTTPLTVASPAVLNFLNDSGAATFTGAYADTLAQTGGVIVITSPAVFSGKILNFAPGDRLIFPGLNGLSLFNITANNFVVAGTDAQGVTQSFTINAAYPVGASLFVGVDAQGDGEVSLRNASADIFINGLSAASAAIVAQPGVAQPLLGFDVLLRGWSGQSISLTLAVANGVLSETNGTAAAQMTFIAANPTALNADLAGLNYTAKAGAVADVLTISSNSALLPGLNTTVPVMMNNAGGTVTGFFGDAGQVSVFNDQVMTPIQGQAAPGEIIITGTKDIASVLMVDGLSGTALLVDGGGNALFDAGANVTLRENVTIGDSTGSGSLSVLTSYFVADGNVTLGAASGMDIAGAIDIAGTLAVAPGAAVVVTGSLVASNISSFGTLSGEGAALVSVGTLSDFGVLNIFDQAVLSGTSLSLPGAIDLGGTATLALSGGVAQSGTLLVGPGAVLQAASLQQNSGLITLAGEMSLSGALISQGSITLAGGRLFSPSVTLLAGAMLSGSGMVGQAGGLGSISLLGGEIQAGGNLLLADNISLSDGSVIVISGFSALDVAHGFSGGTIDFTGGSAELTINDVAQFSGAVANMLDHDAIDLVGVAPSLVSFSGGTISASDANGIALGSFALSVAASQPGVQLLSDGHGGTLITLGGDMPCFKRGTRLLTPNGYKPVEAFKPNDPIITLNGVRRRVCWVGWRTLDLGGKPAASPVRFAAGALGPGVPARPVYLSPLHAVYLQGVLVPACHLVNGATITETPQAAVTYYHIELDRHDLLLADGMAAESYLDTGNRGALYHELGERGSGRVPCAPLVTKGPELAKIRRRLHDIALQAGFCLTYHAGLRGIAGQQSLLPCFGWRRGQRIAAFPINRAAGKLALVTRSAAPADTDPDSEDRRQLGICLARLPSQTGLGQGWYEQAADDQGIWMGASAELYLHEPPRHGLTLALAAVIQSWVAP
ncbi:MAG: Hint domain-containing protein [Acidocella sp.]|nr:Hint domain-containing protein [Acidocella sp.]